MTKETLAATLNVAYGVAVVDGFHEDEKTILAKELASYKLSDEDAKAVLALYNEMPVLQAINIIAGADEDVRKEAHALIVFTCIADGEASEKELGAYNLVKALCNLPAVDVDEARQILGF
ncbi:MAG: hypothetical protein IJS82_03750 [Paludibacteraceae bacterium]|nr:hypothetical protein [Paludibacteraceae bacterium]